MKYKKLLYDVIRIINTTKRILVHKNLFLSLCLFKYFNKTKRVKKEFK